MLLKIIRCEVQRFRHVHGFRISMRIYHETVAVCGALKHMRTNQHNAACGDMKAARILNRVLADYGSIGNLAILIDDGMGDLAILSNPDIGQHNRVYQVGIFLYPNVGK